VLACALPLAEGCSGELRGTKKFDADSAIGPEDAPDAGDKQQPGCVEQEDAGSLVPSCEDYTVEVSSAMANVLVVLDRSGSMHDLTANRWDPSVAAVEDLTLAMPDSMRLGLMTFPGNCLALPTPAEQGDCLARMGSLVGELSCEPGEVRVMPEAGTAQKISEQLRQTAPIGATPTASSLRAAHKLLAGMASPTSTQTILLVTDGAPNCAFGDNGGLVSVGIGIGTASTGQAAAVPQTIAEIKALAKDGIKTYVLGYDTKFDPALKAALDGMAQAGGTGDTEHHAVESRETLRKALTNLAGRTADCELALKAPVVDPWKVQVTLDGQVLTFADANGYALDAAGDNLTLLGSSCDAVRAGAHQLRVKAVCPPAPPATPISDAGEPDGEDAGESDPGNDPPVLFRKLCPPPKPPAHDAGVEVPPVVI
jgi:hypothetical protein